MTKITPVIPNVAKRSEESVSETHSNSNVTCTLNTPSQIPPVGRNDNDAEGIRHSFVVLPTNANTYHPDRPDRRHDPDFADGYRYQAGRSIDRQSTRLTS